MVQPSSFRFRQRAAKQTDIERMPSGGSAVQAHRDLLGRDFTWIFQVSTRTHWINTRVAVVTFGLTVGAALAMTELKMRSGNRACREAEAKKKGWTRPHCAGAISHCISTNG